MKSQNIFTLLFSLAFAVTLLPLSLLAQTKNSTLKKPTQVRVGLIDTGFCRLDRPWVGLNYQFNAVYKSYPTPQASATNTPNKFPSPQVNTIVPPCSQLQTSKKFERRYHAFYVLDVFLRELSRLKVEFELEIFPVQVFNDQGLTDQASWKEALRYLKEKKIDLMILATGLIDPPADFQAELPALTFAAAPTGGPGITKDTRFWPQTSQVHVPQLLVVGQYAPTNSDNLALKKERQGQIDPEILDPDRVGFLAEAVPVNSLLTGTSYSVPLLAARYLSHCAGNSTPADCLNAHTELKEGHYLQFGGIKKRKNYRVFK